MIFGNDDRRFDTTRSDPAIGARQDNVKQNLCPGFGLLRRNRFGFVMGKPVLAGGEDHRGWNDAGNMDRVMSGA